MSHDAPEAAEFPELPAFRSGATRWAVLRGLLRTAFLAALYLLLAVFVLNVGGAALLGILGRSDHVTHVVGVAWRVAHPEFVQKNGSWRHGIMAYTDTIGAAPIVAEGAGTITAVRIRENILGNVSGSDLEPLSPADQVLRRLGQVSGNLLAGWRESERKELQQLPTPVVVAAVVEFASPLSETDYAAFAASTGNLALRGSNVLLSSAKNLNEQFAIRGVYGWGYGMGDPKSDGSVAGFRHWVNSLHNSDRDALAKVGVDLTDLRAAAREGLIHGVIVTGKSPADLLKLLDDPRVGAVHPYDIQFQVEGA